MKIYRIEGPDGKGPWHSNQSGYLPLDVFEYSHCFKTLWEIMMNTKAKDEVISNKVLKQYVCGINDPEALLEWFSINSLKQLKHASFTIMSYETKEEELRYNGPDQVVVNHKNLHNRKEESDIFKELINGD